MKKTTVTTQSLMTISIEIVKTYVRRTTTQELTLIHFNMLIIHVTSLASRCSFHSIPSCGL